MTLRVNLQQTQRNLYLSRLAAAGISASPGNLSESAVYLANACGVTDLPGFDSGEVSVQDEASQLVAPLLQLAPGQTVLDACAAPGGKTTHILESESLLTGVVAVDTNAERLALLKENLDRLQLQASVKQADIMHRDKWWDGTLFDRILLDAPCSATGVIRRHPDIKLLRQQSDIDAYCSRQLSLLKTLWDCLAPGGLLLYTTCSVLRCENELIIDAFLNHNPAAKYQAIAADWGVECRYGRQLLPGHSGHDGFYFARLGKDR